MTNQHTPGPGWVGPAALRRALQLAFRRHYDTTPSGYLRRVRLEAAHRDLQAADSTTGITAAALAATWGFGPGARFTRFYHQHFGMLPSHTLRT